MAGALVPLGIELIDLGPEGGHIRKKAISYRLQEPTQLGIDNFEGGLERLPSDSGPGHHLMPVTGGFAKKTDQPLASDQGPCQGREH
jgi:hypothetical protein